jgi:hypothetical protein
MTCEEFKALKGGGPDLEVSLSLVKFRKLMKEALRHMDECPACEKLVDDAVKEPE